MYRNDNRINLDRRGSVEDANVKIGTLIKTLHLTICKINCIHRETSYKLEDVEQSRRDIIDEYKSEEQIIGKTMKKLLKRTREARKLTQGEVDKIRDALDIIQNIRQLREEKRVLENKPRSTRRGVLMNQLQTLARTTPLWIGSPNEKPPPLCGSIPPLKGYRVLPGDKVAAKNGDDWILAEVITNNENATSLVVEDIDAVDLSKAKMTIPRAETLPLPQWRANPQCDGGALYEVGACVMALYPQTTCFYKGIIASVPEQSTEDYIVLFEDPAYPSGYSPAMSVPQKYVVQFPTVKSEPKSRENAKPSGSKGKNRKKK